MIDQIHPINAAARAITDTLTSVAEANPAFMLTEAKADALRTLASAEAQVAELRLRVMAHGEDVAEETAARDVAAWCAHASRQRIEDARADERLARAIDRRYDALGRGMRQGVVNLSQAHVIQRALDHLPKDVGAEVRELAERTLVGHAADFGPRALARLGRRILDRVAPEIAEEAERKRLAELEREGRLRTRLTLRRQGDGTTRISGRITDAAATRLATYLEAFTNPRVAGQTDHDKDPLGRLPYPRKLGEAFSQMLESMDTSRLPLHGGDATTVIVTIRLDQLRDELGSGDLLTRPHVPGDSDGADALSANDVRRLACNAHIIPTVLGGDSEILDLGKRQRLFTAAQRRALLARDRTCRAEGCDIPGTWAEAHHWMPWQQGGDTDLANGVLLCAHHHHRVHDSGYSAERLTSGDVRFRRRR